ncbi:hypothetical protein B0H17DRAFT_1213632 [Mycena rosella]|uniref:DUF4397 domain-containing protein n=1 Tax=Mycena rosella TaxID=1033263 RepID=A0AAD7G598_MYCRO|nr:hypothetical protein B0H17DRAFT_1213632 [Mycena rosella]
MFLRAILCLSALTMAIAVPQLPYTVVRIVHTTTDVAPYIVDATTTLVFTPGPSTTFANPTGPGL